MILNLTQHNATFDQLLSGVIEPVNKIPIQSLLTFDSLPTALDLSNRAQKLASFCLLYKCEASMIGGAPFFMPFLEVALRKIGVIPFYAFSIRESIDEILPDGKIAKKSVFKHVGFVEGSVSVLFSPSISNYQIDED